MAWLMALHIASLVIWCGCLLYLPALYSAGPRLRRQAEFERIRLMSRMAFVVIASPAAVIAILSGAALVYASGASGGWLAAKLTVVALMAIFHAYCGHMLARLGHESHRRRSYRVEPWLVMPPVLMIGMVLWLVLAKPVLFIDTWSVP